MSSQLVFADLKKKSILTIKSQFTIAVLYIVYYTILKRNPEDQTAPFQQALANSGK